MAILSGIWTALGTSGQTVLILGGLSFLSFIVTKVPGTAGIWLKKIVDFFSANLSHKTP